MKEQLRASLRTYDLGNKTKENSKEKKGTFYMSTRDTHFAILAVDSAEDHYILPAMGL